MNDRSLSKHSDDKTQKHQRPLRIDNTNWKTPAPRGVVALQRYTGNKNAQSLLGATPIERSSTEHEDQPENLFPWLRIKQDSRDAPSGIVESEPRNVSFPQMQPTSKEAVQRQPLTLDLGDGPGSAVEGAGNVSVYVGQSMTSEAGLRQIYTRSAREISEEAVRRVANGEQVSQVARWAIEARNDLKVQIRSKGSPIIQGFAEARNIRKYGNKVGPSYEELIREGKTPEDIVGSSGKVNQKVNRVSKALKVGGRFLIALDVAIVTWEVISAPEGQRLRAAVGGAGAIGGAAAGGWAGAKGGAALGSFLGPVGAAVGGIIGGIGGALFGGWLGKKAATGVYDLIEDLSSSNSEWENYVNAIDLQETIYLYREAKRQRQPRIITLPPK